MFKKTWNTEIGFFKSQKLKEILLILKKEYEEKNIFPKKREVFLAYEYTQIDNLKVVILGQDPYPTKGHAMGLAFSVNKDLRPLPKSLKNIYKELETDMNIKAPEHGDLSSWAKQGVMLLNSSLTVVEGNPGSHSKIGWGELINETLDYINNNMENIVFVLWGKHAQKLGENINREKHYVIESPHPSPFSANRGFFGSKPFSKINSFLHKNGVKEIIWNEKE